MLNYIISCRNVTQLKAVLSDVKIILKYIVSNVNKNAKCEIQYFFNVNKIAQCEKQYFFIFFYLSFPKVLYKIGLLSIIKVPYKSVLLSIITCRHLLLTYYTQKCFIKAFYYLAKIWLC